MSRKQQRRRGYADGGSTDNQYASAGSDDSVKGDTSASWNPAAYNAYLENSQQDDGGYARGGLVRRGYADGGSVDDTNKGTSDYEQQLQIQEEARRKQQEMEAIRAQNEAERQPPSAQVAAAPTPTPDPADVERQRQDQVALASRDVAPPPAAPRPPVPTQAQTPQPVPDDVARQQSDAEALASRGPAPQPQAQPETPTTPWYRQVYNGLLSRFQSDAAAAEEGRGGPQAPEPVTGYAQRLADLQGAGVKQKQIEATPFTPGGSSEGFFDPVRDAAPPPEKPGFFQRINPYARTPMEDLSAQAADTVKGSGLYRLLGGEGSHTISELNEIQKTDPGRDISSHIQDLWHKAELAGDRGTAERLQQTVRNGFNTGTSVGLDRLNNGDLNGGLQAFQHSLNMFTDDRKYELNPTTDGRVQVKITPEKPGMGEPTVTLVSPAQLRDLFSSNGGQFDHLMHNGVKESLDILTGQNKPLNLPNAGERVGQSGVPYNQPRENVLMTEGGFHPDSPMGLMDRAQQAAKFGRPDREATEYAARAQAAVQSGVPADQVHQYLRTNGAAPQGQEGPPAPAATVGPDGRPVYAPETNIPGAGAAPAQGLPRSDVKTIGPGDTYETSRERTREEHADAKGGGGSKTGDRSTSALYPESHFINKGFTPYNYGERRAGSYAQPTNQADYQPISRDQGPQPPPGFQPLAPTRDIFETARGGGRENLAPPKDYSREEGIRYNQQLADRQNQFRPPDDTAYQARNRQLNQQTGYAATMDKARADQPRQIAEANAAEKARSTEAMRGDTDAAGYRLTGNQLAQRRALEEQQGRAVELKAAPAQAQAAGRENVADINQAGRLQTTRERNQSREGIAAGQNQSRETVAAGQNQSRENIAAAQRQFLGSKQAQDILARRGSDEMKAVMRTYNTKLVQGIKPNEDEVANYNTLVQAVQQEQNQPAAAAPVATDERPRLGQPAGAATPPGPANPGYKWQHNPTTGEWRQALV